VIYLDFYFDDFAHNKQSIFALMDDCVRGLIQVERKTSGFFSVASKLCVLSRDSAEIFERFVPFLTTLTPLFSQLVLDSIKLRSTPADWAEISDYRARISPFYSNMLPSFVWLNHLFPPDTVVIDFETMISFFLLEMTISSESWRIYAGFSALSKVLQYSGNKITGEYFTLIVRACVDSARKNATMLKPLVSDFLHFASKQTDKINTELWNGLVSTLLQHDNECTSCSLALLLQNSQAVEPSRQFASFIVKQLSRGKFTQDEAISLTTILFEVGPQQFR
jgi:hypothetical protein